ncbi:hypothetical protein L218DRAFT_949414 [Marasmius fiardii PR-910]|nr:hypothetical protein L218DRAFT_949414 [Marasmius fiardii PR-910]
MVSAMVEKKESIVIDGDLFRDLDFDLGLRGASRGGHRSSLPLTLTAIKHWRSKIPIYHSIKGVLDIFLGGVLGGSWANTAFFAIELTQIYRYFSRYPNDPIYLKLMVALALALDTIGTLVSSAAVYLYTVTHWGGLSYAAKQDWPYTNVFCHNWSGRSSFSLS